MIESIKIMDKSKYFYMLLMFLWCAYTAPFLKPFDLNYIFSSLLYIIIYFLYFNKYCIAKSKYALGIILGVMFFWYIAQCFKNTKIVDIDFRLIYSVILCHISFYLYKGKDFFFYLEKVLVHLTLISLVVWGLGFLATGPMQSFVRSVSVWDNGNTTFGNMIFVALGNQWSNGILRNIGFTWEAGRFSSFLVIGLFNNLIIHDFKIKGNRPLFILLIGLISTFSTTGFGAAICVLLLYVYNKSAKYKILIIIGCVLLFPTLFAFDFIGDKLRSSMNIQQEIHDMEYMFFVNNESQITPQRFTGLYLELQNWLHDFWFGYNLNQNSYAENVLFKGYSVWLSNGIIQIFSKYGFFVGVFFYWQLFKSSIRLSNDFCYKGKFLFALMFILLSISYDFWSSAITLHYILYDLYVSKDISVSINYNKCLYGYKRKSPSINNNSYL